jgi:DNA-binding transcriptional ArsR family regulator
MDLIIGKAGGKDFSVDAQELVTGRTCIIAQSGAGKSWAIAVLCERLCRSGIGFCIIDTEGEYFSLKEKYHLLWLGSDEHADLDIDTVNIRDVMSKAIRNNTAVIFDVSETEMRERVSELAHALYEIESEIRLPYLLIVEEADKFIPQSRESLKKLEEISRRGRKRGLGLLVATQRPSFVNKNVLSQCNNQIIGKLSIENDLRAVDLFFSSRKEVEELATLEPGEFFVLGKITPRKTQIAFSMRETKHQGLTPRLSPHPPALSPPVVAPEPEKRPVFAPASEKVSLSVPMKYPGIVPVMTREEALDTAHQKRKKGFLGRKEEHILSVDLVFWPIISATVRYLSGLLRTPREISFSLDGRGARIVRIAGGLSVRADLSPWCGLPPEAITVFRQLSLKGSTTADLEAATHLSPSVIRESLRRLTEKKIVTEGRLVSSTRCYVPLVRVRIPRFASLRDTHIMGLSPVSGSLKEVKVTEEDIRSVLKGLEPTAEIVTWKVWYYPLYEVAISSSHGDRLLFVDGIGGKLIPLAD